MSAKLWCAVCQTTRSPLWLASDLVLHSTQLTVLRRLKGLDLQLHAHCILCTVCYALVEHWDEQIATAAKTQQLLKGRIPRPQAGHLPSSIESNDILAVNNQPENHDSGRTALPEEYPVEKTEAAATKVSTAGLAVTEVGVVDSGVPEVNSSYPGVTEVHSTDSSALEVNATDPGVLEVNATDTGVTEVSVTDLTAPEPGAPDSVMTDEAPQCEPSRPTQAPCASPRKPPARVRFHCHVCDKGFARRGSLHDHLAMHNGTKTYACTECDVQFQYRDGLLVHRRRLHGQGRLPCPCCPIHFDKSCNLRRHMRVHTGERPFGCAFCPKRFAQSNGLKKHVRGLHAERVAADPE